MFLLLLLRGRIIALPEKRIEGKDACIEKGRGALRFIVGEVPAWID